MARRARPDRPRGRGSWIWTLSILVVVALLPLAATRAPVQANAAVGGAQLRQVQVGEDEDEPPAEEDEGDEGDEREEEREERLGVYESPRYGFVLEYDPDLWQLVEEGSDDLADHVLLFNEFSFVRLSATDAFDGDPGECLDAWVESLESGEGIEDFGPLEDADGERIAAEDDDSARAAYGFSSSDGEEVFDVSCLVLIDGEVTLAVILETFAGAYDDQKAATEDLLEGLDLSGVAPPADPAAAVEVLGDNFNDEAAGLFSTASAEPDLVRYAYDDGEYVIETLKADAGVWQAQPEGAYADVEIAVDARIDGRTAGRFVKVGCRFTRTRAGFDEYSLVVDPASRRALLYVSVGEEVEVLVDETGLDAVNPGEAWNRLELRCVGETIGIVINGEAVAEVEDDTHGAGAIYLGAGTYSDVGGTVEARFDDFEVTVLDPVEGDEADERDLHLPGRDRDGEAEEEPDLLDGEDSGPTGGPVLGAAIVGGEVG